MHNSKLRREPARGSWLTCAGAAVISRARWLEIGSSLVVRRARPKPAARATGPARSSPECSRSSPVAGDGDTPGDSVPEFSAPGAPASGVTHPAPALGDPAAVGDSTNGSGGASEWHFNTDQNEMQRWLDGTELTDMHVVDRPTTAGSGCLGDATGDEWLAPPRVQHPAPRLGELPELQQRSEPLDR